MISAGNAKCMQFNQTPAAFSAANLLVDSLYAGLALLLCFCIEKRKSPTCNTRIAGGGAAVAAAEAATAVNQSESGSRRPSSCTSI
jgi:hypothetical protein